MSITTITWQNLYGTIFPILGLAVILFGIWWTRPAKTKEEGSQQHPSEIEQEYSPEVGLKLDELIAQGETLVGKMQRPDFQIFTTEKMGESVRQWLESGERDVWKLIPERARHIVAEQGDFSPDERLRYQGWSNDSASLRVWVDRRLSRLREVRSQIKVAETTLGIKAYAGRPELRKIRGELSKELEGYERVWAIWHEGRQVLDAGEVKRCHIERLILTDPSDDYMMKHFENRWGKGLKSSEGTTTLKGDTIKDTAAKFAKTGTEVRYYSSPISDTLILADTVRLSDDTFSDKAWARIETGIPFHDTNNRVNIVITKGQKPEQFEALLIHFGEIWDNSRPI